jgi:hypothetical protein
MKVDKNNPQNGNAISKPKEELGGGERQQPPLRCEATLSKFILWLI